MENNIRKELISYYKWLVNLSAFIITVVVSLVSVSENLYFSDMLKWGILMLGLSIFFNWLIIKKLVIVPIVGKTPLEDIKSIHLIFIKNIFLAKIYGLIQNWAFIIGLVLIVISFISGANSIGMGISLPKL